MITLRLNHLALQDFRRALRRVFWRDLLGWLTQKSNKLLSFDQIRQGLPLKRQHSLGLQVVLVDEIVGSEEQQRSRDFDRTFWPRSSHLQARWLSIYQAYAEQVTLPPVELLKLGEEYFVRDGHHRVSVARFWGQDFIDAVVTEVEVSRPVKRYKKCVSNFCGSKLCLAPQ